MAVLCGRKEIVWATSWSHSIIFNIKLMDNAWERILSVYSRSLISSGKGSWAHWWKELLKTGPQCGFLHCSCQAHVFLELFLNEKSFTNMGIVVLIRKWGYFSHEHIIIIIISTIVIIIIIATMRTIAKAEFCFKTAQCWLERIIFYVEKVSRCLVRTATRVFLHVTHAALFLSCLMGLLVCADDGRCRPSNTLGSEDN